MAVPRLIAQGAGCTWIGLRNGLHVPEEPGFQFLNRKRFSTDNDSWSDAEIILAYRGQFQIEQAFETMKDPHFVSWSPMWHWTDHNVRVHAFYCVLALTLASLLQRELHAHGIEKIQKTSYFSF